MTSPNIHPQNQPTHQSIYSFTHEPSIHTTRAFIHAINLSSHTNQSIHSHANRPYTQRDHSFTQRDHPHTQCIQQTNQNLSRQAAIYPANPSIYPFIHARRPRDHPYTQAAIYPANPSIYPFIHARRPRDHPYTQGDHPTPQSITQWNKTWRR